MQERAGRSTSGESPVRDDRNVEGGDRLERSEDHGRTWSEVMTLQSQLEMIRAKSLVAIHRTDAYYRFRIVSSDGMRLIFG